MYGLAVCLSIAWINHLITCLPIIMYIASSTHREPPYLPPSLNQCHPSTLSSGRPFLRYIFSRFRCVYQLSFLCHSLRNKDNDVRIQFSVSISRFCQLHRTPMFEVILCVSVSKSPILYICVDLPFNVDSFVMVVDFFIFPFSFNLFNLFFRPFIRVFECCSLFFSFFLPFFVLAWFLLSFNSFFLSHNLIFFSTRPS